MHFYRWGVFVGNHKTFVQVCLYVYGQTFLQFNLFGVYRFYRLKFQVPLVILHD